MPPILVFEDVSDQIATDIERYPTAQALLDAFDFEVITEDRNRGYNYTTHWVLIPLHDFFISQHGSSESVWLGYESPLIDTIKVYFSRPHGGWSGVAETGDQHPVSTRQRHALHFYFNVPRETQYALVKLQTVGSLQLNFALYSEQQLNGLLFDQAVANGLFFGALVIMIFYNLFFYSMAREESYLYYVVILSAITVFMVTILGFGSLYFWKQHPGWMNQHIQPISVGICLCFIAQFTRTILDIRALSKKLDRILLIACWGSALMALMGVFAPYSFTVKVTSTWPNIVVIAVIAAGLLALIRRQTGAVIFVAAWGAGLFGAMLFSAQQQGWLPLNDLTGNALKFGIVVNVVLLSFTMASHVRALRKAKENYQREARQNYELALVDGLTGVPNRRAFDERLRVEIDRARRDKKPIALLMIDIDHFKAYNDTYGHRRGDDTLIRTALIMRNCLRRPSDALFRYGGEEFAVVLPDTTIEGAQHTGDRVMREISKLAIPHRESPFTYVTVSIGGAVANCANLESRDFINLADKSLYQAKREGRNRLILTEQIDRPVVQMGDYFKNTPKDGL